MGVDLGLQQGQLRPAQALLPPFDLPHLIVQPADHLLHALAQGSNFPNFRRHRLLNRQVAGIDPLRPAAQLLQRRRDGAAQPYAVAQQKDDGQRRRQNDQGDLHTGLPGDYLLHRVQLRRLVVEVGVHILLHQGGQHIDIVFQLGQSLVIVRGFLNLVDFPLQILAQVQHAGDGLPAVFLGSGIDQRFCQGLSRPDLLNGQSLGILALDDVIVHPQVDGILELPVEFRGGGDVVQKSCVVAAVRPQHQQHRHQQHRQHDADGRHQTPQPSLDGIDLLHFLPFPLR